MLHNSAAQQQPGGKPALAPKALQIIPRAQGRAYIPFSTPKQRSRHEDTQAARLTDGNMDTHIIHIRGAHSPPPRSDLTSSTVFGKHCECIAQKCTHLERLPPLASHLLLPSHCVLTLHGGKKIDIRSVYVIAGIRIPNTLDQDSCIHRLSQSNSHKHKVVPCQYVNADLFNHQITTFC